MQPFAYGVAAVCFYAVSQGLGQHAAHVAATSDHDPNRVLSFMYVAGGIYDFGITQVKGSPPLFYARIFGDVPGFKAALIMIGILCILWNIVTLLTSFFSCAVVRDRWEIGGGEGQKCLNSYGVNLWTALANVLIDVIILVLPELQLWRLQMGKHKKLGLAGILICGYG